MSNTSLQARLKIQVIMELVNRKAEEKNLSPLHNRFSSTTTGTTANIENGMPKKNIY